MNIPLVEFKNVTKRFGEQTVLENVNLEIYEGEVTTIIGLSGAGKSVLLKHIIGLLKPDEGKIFLRGKLINNMNKAELVESMSKISYMFQSNALFSSMTVYDNIALPLVEKTNMKKAEIHERVMARIEQTELTEAADKYPSELSGGMQKRAALARALITDPQVVLFDEPTTGQDPVRKNAILSMIAQYQKKFNFTAIIVSHEIPDVYFISNRILALYDKTIVFQGTPEELANFNHPFNDEVIRSLEGLQKELTGLYSRRQFKILHRTQLQHKKPEERYCVAVFDLSDMGSIISRIGYDAAQERIHSIGIYIDKHFGAIGGFSTRRKADEFVTVLPFSNLVEAENILKEFIEDFQKSGISDIEGKTKRGVHLKKSVDFSIRAGIAEGKPVAGIDSVIKLAKSNQKEIGRLRCAVKE
ncbi:MAG: ATP-binding cassette domain-containing protein [Syntrophaceae bacterium]|nr:ATP-binding cassette domain-containing protein [Syntrophaceae bacterium]